MAIYTVFFTVFASLMTAAASSNLFLRTDSSSCASSYSQCGSAFPADFCCPESSTCLGVDSNSTVVCCPSGSSCDYIAPITCDIQQQNATANPDASVKTTRLTDKLSSCGDTCCPFGYSCPGNTCSLDRDTASSGASITASASASTTSTLVGTSTSVSESATTTAPSTFSTILVTITPAATTHSASQTDKLPVGIIVPAVVVSLIIILTVTTITIILFRKRRASRRSLKPETPSSLYIIGNKAELPGESYRVELDGKSTMAMPFAQDNAINYGKPAELP